MKVTVAVLADYTNVSKEGKLNILGIFDEVRGPRTPLRHPEMKLVLRLEVELAELNRKHSIEVRCMDADGVSLIELNGEFAIRKAQEGMGTTASVNHVLGFQNIVFPHFGTFTFSVFIDGRLEATINLRVVKFGDEQPMLPGV
jgi:hypothetical protein